MEAVVARRPLVLEEIDPHSEWVPGADFDMLVIDVTGFSKDQLKVLVEPDGRLKVTGERAVDGGEGRQWCHFTKRFSVPAGSECYAAAIRVHLDKGMLYVQVPRRPGVDLDGEPAERYDGALLPRRPGVELDGEPAEQDDDALQPRRPGAELDGEPAERYDDAQPPPGRYDDALPPRRPGVDLDGEPAERYDDAQPPRRPVVDLGTGDGGSGSASGGGYGMDLVTTRREEQQHPVRPLAEALSRHRQVVLDVVIAVVLLWLVAFTNKLKVVLAIVLLWLVAFANRPGGGGRTRND